MKSFFAFVICFSLLFSSPVFAEEAKTDANRKAVADLGVDYPQGEIFGGVGMQFGSFQVSSVVPGYPAARAGIRQGDGLFKVDDKQLSPEMTNAEVINLIRGKPGTKVTLVVTRAGEKEPRTFHLVREMINSVYTWHGRNPKFYEDALKLLQPLAEKGIPEAQNSLGVLYESGLAVTQDEKQAAEWYRKAAAQGNAWAQKNLGVLYYDGRGVKQSDAEAFQWMSKAGSQGHKSAIDKIAQVIEAGKGEKVDLDAALDWYRGLAEQGNPQAQYNLGKLYYAGKAVTQSGEDALKWMRKAAEQDYDEATEWLADTYAFRRPMTLGADNQWVKPDYKGIKPDRNEAIKWYRKLAEKGDSSSQYLLLRLLAPAGLRFANDQANQQEACFWALINGGTSYEDVNDKVLAGPGAGADVLKRVAEMNARWSKSDTGAQIYAGIMKRLSTDEIAICRKRAHEWKSPDILQKLAKAELGDKDAQYEMGSFYSYRVQQKQTGPEYVQANVAETEKWYLKAAEQGHSGAQNSLGELYYFDTYGKENKQEAFKWFIKATEGDGWRGAAYRLGYMYQKGEGAEQDFVKAYMWHTIAQASVNANHEKLDGSEDIAVQTRERDEMAKAMTAEQIAEAQKQTMEWLKEHAERGETLAQKSLGKAYATGLAGKQDIAEAYFWLLLWDKGKKFSSGTPDEWTENLAKRITTEQAAAMKKRAEDWKPAEGLHGNP